MKIPSRCPQCNFSFWRAVASHLEIRAGTIGQVPTCALFYSSDGSSLIAYRCPNCLYEHHSPATPEDSLMLP